MLLIFFVSITAFVQLNSINEMKLANILENMFHLDGKHIHHFILQIHGIFVKLGLCKDMLDFIDVR
jgi:hypothetical protein